MGVILTPNTGTAVTLEFKQIDVTDETSNEVIPIPNAVHYYVFLGNKGSTYECTGMIHSVADYNAMRAWNGQNYLTVSYGVGIPVITEFAAGTTWAIIKRTLTRKGGYMAHWEFKLSLMQVYSGSTTKADGSSL
jgi:hypothetical protein